jgi:hypothetical protein
LQHQKDVAVAAAALQQRLREQKEVARQQKRDNESNSGRDAYENDFIPAHAQHPRPNAPWSDSAWEGHARDVQLESVNHVFFGPHVPVHVLTFRVEGFDPTRDQGLWGSVEMRGDRLQGVVRNGDWVKVTGHAKAGMMMATLLEVHSPNGAVLTRRSGSSPGQKALQGFAVTALVAIVLMMLMIFIL